MSAHLLSQNIYILDALRTPVGSTFKGLKNFTASRLASLVIKGILERNKDLCIDEVILGNTVSAGTGQSLARQAIIESSLPVQTPGLVINSVCGSGLQAAILAVQSIVCNKLGVIIAGGTESASHSPKLIKADKDAEESLITDGLWCAISDKHMGEIAEELAKKYKVSRKDQDAFSYQSHRKALSAQEKEKFKNEIVIIRTDKGLVEKDERPRSNISMEKMEKLPGAFKEQGTVTAGNASAPADGAAVMLIVSGDVVQKKKLKPKARIIGYSTVALSAEQCFETAVVAVNDCLKTCDLKINDIDLFEIGESFASQAVYTQKALGIPDEKMNIYGGDIALGHPLGSTGARMLTTLLSALHNERKKRGLVTVCFGSGGGVCMIIEKSE